MGRGQPPVILIPPIAPAPFRKILSLSCGAAASQIVTLSERSEVEGGAKLVLAQSKDL
jgi:hypothetical protein